jgi:hypothetical protein
MAQELVTIREVAAAIDRKPATLRDWERRGILPKSLRPVARNSRRWRCWRPEQVEGIKQWMEERNIYPGKGLSHYQPDTAKMHQHLEAMRRPRKHFKEAA